MSGTIVICGYGPGISDAVARRFGREGLSVALVGRTEERLAQGCAALEQNKVRAKAFKCDVGDLDAVRTMLARVRTSLGNISVVHWNALASGAGDLLTSPPAELHGAFDVTVHGLVACVQEALPDLEKAKGAVLVTGGGLAKYGEGVDRLAATWNAMGLSVAKAAQHKLVGVLHQKLAPKGIYVGEVMVLGLVKGTRFDTGNATIAPDSVAERFHQIYTERKEAYVELS